MHPCDYDVFHQIRLYKHDDDDDDRVLDCSQHTSTYSYHFQFPELTMQLSYFLPVL